MLTRSGSRLDGFTFDVVSSAAAFEVKSLFKLFDLCDGCELQPEEVANCPVVVDNSSLDSFLKVSLTLVVRKNAENLITLRVK